MEIVRDVIQLRAKVRAWRLAGERIALVPTMGALHAGHMSLVALAKTKADRVITTIFVNPTQFGPNEDLSRYPRQEALDVEALKTAQCDLLFAPTPDVVYPAGFGTMVTVDGPDKPMEGAVRPGHFNGVATVVSKLLLMATPDVAIFGEKDWQQLAVIRRVVADLNIDVEIVGAPIMREADGLAMSSRNAYLSPDERAAASHLPRLLQEAGAQIAAGTPVATALQTATTGLEAAGFAVDYLLLADGQSLETIERLQPGARLFVAAKIGTTRLIDNIAVGQA